MPLLQGMFFCTYEHTGEVSLLYYSMCTLQDMDLNQEFNQSVTDGRTRAYTIYISRPHS